MQNLRILLLLLIVVSPRLHGQHHRADLIATINTLLLNMKYQEAIQLIDAESAEARSILLDNKKAEALTHLGNFAEAQKLLETIEAELTLRPDKFLRAVTETNRGFLQLSQGRNDLAEASLQNALIKLEESGKAETPEAADALSTLGVVYMSLGKYAQAQEQLHKALSLRQTGLKDANELIAATYNDLGLVYSQTDKDKALDYYEEAGKLYRSLYGDHHPKIAIAHINTGIIFRDFQLYEEALENFESALKIADEVYKEPHPTKAIALYNLGQTWLKLHNEEKAMEYYGLAIRTYEDCFGPRHPEVASVLNAMGNLHLERSDFDEALSTYQKSLQANVQDFHDNDYRANPGLKNYYHGTQLLHTLLFKAEAFESRYRRKSLKFGDLREALRILAKCDSLIDQLRQHSTNESDKLQLGIMANEVYSDGVRIAHEAGMNALKKDIYFQQAFYFAEKSKSSVLLESISDANAKSFAGIPSVLLEEEKNLKSALTLTAQKLAQKPTVEQEKKLREESFTLKRRYQAFVQKLEKEFPDYFNLKFNAATPSVAQLQALLQEHTAVVSYFIDEKENQLYIFLIGKKDFQVFQRTLTENFYKYITGLRNGLYFNEINTLTESAVELGGILIPPFPSRITDVVIIPTGRLGLIPFETLLMHPPKGTGYTSFPWLLKRFNIRYEFSAGLILQKSTKTRPPGPPSIFLCAPVTFGDNEYLPDLPGTEREVKEISMLFRDKDLHAAAYTHEQAAETQIKTTTLKDFQFLHFATHGVVDELNPDLSRIFLQPDQEREDGNLFAGEIYNLELNANLVTLSACQTGTGKILKGEGVIGLSRALVYAGAKNMLVSFWNVADESTAVLMKDFYQYMLANGSTNYGRDLRQAKMKLLETGKYAAPFYWAPFVLIGF